MPRPDEHVALEAAVELFKNNSRCVTTLGRKDLLAAADELLAWLRENSSAEEDPYGIGPVDPRALPETRAYAGWDLPRNFPVTVGPAGKLLCPSCGMSLQSVNINWFKDKLDMEGHELQDRVEVAMYPCGHIWGENVG